MRSICVSFCAAMLSAIFLGHALMPVVKADKHQIVSVEPQDENLFGKTDYIAVRQFLVAPDLVVATSEP